MCTYIGKFALIQFAKKKLCLIFNNCIGDFDCSYYDINECN